MQPPAHQEQHTDGQSTRSQVGIQYLSHERQQQQQQQHRKTVGLKKCLKLSIFNEGLRHCQSQASPLSLCLEQVQSS